MKSIHNNKPKSKIKNQKDKQHYNDKKYGQNIYTMDFDANIPPTLVHFYCPF